MLLLIGNLGLLSFLGYKLLRKRNASEQTVDTENNIEDDNQEIIEEVTSDTVEENKETFFGITIDYKQSPSYINSIEEMNLRAIDEYNYIFDYNGNPFKASYIYDNWTIFDSYRVKNVHDMTIICQGLIDLYPIHGADRVSYRTADDMAYEWLQHNYAYEILPKSSFRDMARDVDFDPDDQGKSLEELYKSRKQ